jgi:hypothetical protein
VLARANFRALTGLWLASQRRGHRAFRAALERPAATQAAVLRALLTRHAGSAGGRRFGFARIRTPREYQTAVPVVGWDEVAPWVEAVKRGEHDVLTAEPVVIFETTGGSGGGAKYVPYTAGLLAEFQRALAAWMVDLYDHRPALRRGGAYWSVSPLAREREVTPGGIPVGFDDDARYFGRLARWLVGRLLLTPPELALVDDIAASRYVTLRWLLQSDDLALISVWNPSFLTLLIEALPAWAPALIEDIERGTLRPPVPLPAALARRLERRLAPAPGRARALARLLARTGRLAPTDVWPRLALISCWTSAAAARLVEPLAAAFPGVEIQGKGLLATEGVVSIPLTGHRGAAVAVTSHFYEFAPIGAPDERPRLVHELDGGGEYEVILTTGGGLYRYALGDRLRVVGRVAATPLVEFVGRVGLASDLAGEKLAEAHVARALEAATAAVGVTCAFLLLAPELGAPPCYVLFAEAPAAGDEALARLAGAVEARLYESPSYAYCRRLGQLGAVRAVRVGRGAADAYLGRCRALGQRAGAVKPPLLHRAPGWREHLAGAAR